MILGYIRVSTHKQNNSKQKHLILEYAHERNIKVDEFVEVEESSRKTAEKRKISEIKEKLKKDDTLIVAELSRLGRNMLQVMKLIQDLSDTGIKLVFIRQPELSTFNTAHSKLHDAIKELLLKEVSFTAISKIIDAGSYMGVRNYIHENKELSQIIKQNKESLLAHIS